MSRRCRASPNPHAEQPKYLELPVEELVRRARPLPPREALVIDDIDEQEGRAFLAAVEE